MYEAHQPFGEEGHHHLRVDDPMHLGQIRKMDVVEIGKTLEVDIITVLEEGEEDILLLLRLGRRNYEEPVEGIPLP